MTVARHANLCWGQRYHWLRYQQMPSGSRHDAHITGSFPLPAGTSAARVQSLLDYLIRRHEVLRTVYDAGARPWPQQRVQRPAPLPTRWASTEPDGTPSPAEVMRELTVADFDPATEWPIRACVLTVDGEPRTLHVVFNHVAFDDVSLATLWAEMEALLESSSNERPATLAPVPHQPVDLARDESRCTVDDAMTHWHTEVANLPTDMFLRRRRAGTGAHSASLTSPSLLSTARTIAERARVWPSAVHLAAYAVTMTAYCGTDLLAHRMYTSQRQASTYHEVMTCMSYPTIVAVDLSDDPTFSEVLRRTAARVEQSLAHAHVPYDEVVEAVGLDSSRRGRPIRVASELNFLNQAPRTCGTTRDRFTRNPPPTDWATSGSDTYLRVYEWSDGITLMLQAMDAVFGADDVETFLRGYAALLDAHLDETVDRRVSEVAADLAFTPVAGPEPATVGAELVDPVAIEAALAEHRAVREVRVRLTDDGVHADVQAAAPVTPAELRATALDAMHHHGGARCPDWFRISLPDGPDTEGDGKQGRHADTDPERALATAVAEANELTEVDVTDSYLLAGGRVLRVPRVLSALGDLGYHGVSLDDLTSARPLLTLADRLVRS